MSLQREKPSAWTEISHECVEQAGERALQFAVNNAMEALRRVMSERPDFKPERYTITLTASNAEQVQ